MPAQMTKTNHVEYGAGACAFRRRLAAEAGRKTILAPGPHEAVYSHRVKAEDRALLQRMPPAARTLRISFVELTSRPRSQTLEEAMTSETISDQAGKATAIGARIAVCGRTTGARQ